MIHIKELLICWLISMIDIHKVLCIDHLWLNVGVKRLEYEPEPCVQISKMIWYLYARYYNFFLASINLLICTYRNI